jgi:hypothetical protein
MSQHLLTHFDADSQENSGTMPLEQVLITARGQQMVAEIIAVDGLDGAVASQLDMLDVPFSVRVAITDAVIKKRANMVVRDSDASYFLANADSVLRQRADTTFSEISVEHKQTLLAPK